MLGGTGLEGGSVTGENGSQHLREMFHTYEVREKKERRDKWAWAFRSKPGRLDHSSARHFDGKGEGVAWEKKSHI